VSLSSELIDMSYDIIDTGGTCRISQ